MHDLETPDENFSDEKTESSGRSTGPGSPDGKATASMERTGRLEPVVRDRRLNRLSHGCRSEQLLIPGEDPAELEFTFRTWLGAYNPQNPIAQTLVEETAKAQWFLRRNEKWLHQIQVRLPFDAWLWTDENHKLLANATRYKTAAERSFYRAFNNLEAYYKRQADRAAQAEKARALMAKANLEWAKKKAQAAAKHRTATQHVVVVVNKHGDCVTTSVPGNEHIVSRGNSENPPEFVTRYLLFNFGVPAAYDWTNPTPIQRREGTIGIQHFLYSDWLKQIEAEKTLNTGHLAPSHASLLHDPD